MLPVAAAPHGSTSASGSKVVGHRPAWAAARPQPPQNALLRLLWAPVRLYLWLLYDHRPDIASSKTTPREWRMLQSQWRWAQAMVCYSGPPSHILWHIKWPLAINMTVATAIVLHYNLIRYDASNDQVLDDIARIVGNAKPMYTFMMSLLLAWKVNRAYERWWDARKEFGGVCDAATILAQQALSFVDSPAMQSEIARWSKVWCYTVLSMVRCDAQLPPEATALMSEEEAALWNAAPEPRHLVAMQLRQLITAACDSPLPYLDNPSLQAGIASANACHRIMLQALPYSITLMCTGFLEIFLLFFPASMASAYGGWLFGLVLYGFFNMLMLGVDEVANQLEQPFPHMPLAAIVDTTVADIDRLPHEFAALSGMQQRALELLQVGKQPAGGAAAGPPGVRAQTQQHSAVQLR